METEEPERRAGRPRRALWLLNHKTLMQIEPDILIALGYEVFVPKIIPGEGFRSGATTYDFDRTLTLSSDDLDRLNRHDFYNGDFDAAFEEFINREFDIAFIILFADIFETSSFHFQATSSSEHSDLKHHGPTALSSSSYSARPPCAKLRVSPKDFGLAKPIRIPPN